MNAEAVISVTQLNRYVKFLFEEDKTLCGVMVRGEISNFTRHYKSGHLYFTLKDQTASIKGVMFQSYASRLPFVPENGMSVIISGAVTLYERDGSYQLKVTDMQPDGIGALHLAFEQLKERLLAEGLFDAAHKRMLPQYPERIGIVTSEGAAALQDMLNILSRRYPVAKVILVPAQVQGDGAAQTISAGIRMLNTEKACDVIIIGRGGGSIEDLWAFNDESLAREIYRSEIPIVSAVGHETDFTISDFVADLRAPTPSAAAELVSASIEDLRYYLDDLYNRCERLAYDRIEHYMIRLSAVKAHLFTPLAILDSYTQKLEWMRRSIHEAILHRFEQQAQQLRHLSGLIDAKSPTKLLAQGYSLSSLPDGRTIHSVMQVHKDDLLVTQVSDGKIHAKVVEIEKLPN